MNKPGVLSARWSRRERDIELAWGDKCRKADAGLLHEALSSHARPVFEGRTLVDELRRRGYDIRTLRFSIRKLATEPLP